MTPVSVIIPALNEERFLPELLRSLLACSGREIDIVVVDGHSEDRTQEVAARVGDEAPAGITVRVVESTVRNVAQQRNQGASVARHDLLLFFDADTRIPTPDHLDRLLALFEAGGYAAASCRFDPMEKDPRAVLYYRFLYAFHKLMERWNPYALGACILTRRAVFDRLRGFDPTIRVNEDANYCMRASRVGKFRILPVAIGISTRRFSKYGYFRMAWHYIGFFLSRTFLGETRDDRIPYEFGKYD